MASQNHINQLLEEANLAHVLGDKSQISKIYLKILSIDPDCLPAIYNLALIAIESGQLSKAISLLTRGKHLNTPNDEFKKCCRTLVSGLIQHGYLAQAEEWLQYLMFHEPHSAEIQSLIKSLQIPSHIDKYVFDQAEQKWLKRYRPYEKDTFVYAIDVVGTCNLRCPSCPVGNMPNDPRPKGFMDVDLFKKILEKIKSESPTQNPEIWLFNWGEPLLHPNIAEIINLVNQFGYKSMISTNLNIKKNLEEVVQSKPTRIKISISGFSKNTYPKTHTKGDIELVKTNLYLLKSYMKKYQGDTPTTNVYIGFHLYKNNFSEAQQVKELCAELGFGYAENAAIIQPVEKMMSILNDDDEAIDSSLVNNLLVHPKQLTFDIKNKRSGEYDCELRFNMMSINFDGSVGLCCSTYAQSNVLANNFLDHDHAKLQALKYRNDFCKSCRQMNLDYSLCDVISH